MKPNPLFLLSAFVALAGVNLHAQQMASIAIAPGTGTVTLVPRWSIGSGIAGFQFAAPDLLVGGGGAQFYSLKGTPISAGGDTTAFASYNATSGAATNLTDIGSKLTPTAYSGLTFAEPDLQTLGTNNFYTLHHKSDGDHIAAIVPRAGTASTVADIKQLSTSGGFFALAFAAPNAAGNGPNQFYYLRTNSTTQASIFGVTDLAPIALAQDKFTLGTGYTALSFADPDLGYGAQKFYYLRRDPITNFTILGTFNGTTGARADIANLGSEFTALTFTASDVFGTNNFFALGTLNSGWQSISFAALPDRNISAGAFTVAPVASSGLPIALTVVTGSTGSAAITGPFGGVFTVRPTAPGLITLQATQAGQAEPLTPFESNMLRQSFTASGTTLLAITKQPESRAVSIGANTTFSVTAVGTSALSYQWRLAGVDILNNLSAFTSALTLINVQTADYGSYDVVVTNASGSIVSDPVTLSEPVAPTITSANTALGNVGVPFAYTIVATSFPTNYGATSLPLGLTVDGNTGIISGTPTEVGFFNATLRATNFTGSDLKPLTIIIAPAPVAPTITSAATASGTVGAAFAYTITANGLPTSFTAADLPPGLSISGSTGAITGTPTATGVFTVGLQAINAVGTGSATLTITVAPAPVAPTITSATTASGTVGVAFQYQIAANGLPTNFGATGLPGGLSVSATTGLISGSPTTAGISTVTLSATNTVGTGGATLTITIVPAPTPPVITSSLALSGTVGRTFPAYFITASGFPTSYAATGLPAGLGINTTNGGISGSPTTAGVFTVTLSATNAIGTGTATLIVTIAPAPIPPAFSLHPVSQTVAAGSSVTFTASASGLPTPTYQWNFNNAPIPGATTSTLILPSVQFANAGTYTVTATNSAAATTSNPATLSLLFSRISNFSARAFSGPGAQTLIMGFNVSGNNKSLLVRGVGQTLATYGLVNILADPLLTLSSSSATTVTNDDWQTGNNATQFAALFDSVGAFALGNGSKDSALLTTANAGSFDISLTRPGGSGTGVALTEIYDIDQNLSSRLINVSARIQIGLGENLLITGFIIQGNASKTVLIRGIGPSLTPYGVEGVLADPQIAVYSGSTLVGSNDDWSSGSTNGTQVRNAALQVGAFGLFNGSKDAAVVLTLQPGNYSVQLTGVGNTTGVALVEVYDVQ